MPFAATPLIFTALSCWKRFNDRGTTLSFTEAIDESLISCPFGPVTYTFSNCSGFSRSVRSSWGMTL